MFKHNAVPYHREEGGGGTGCSKVGMQVTFEKSQQWQAYLAILNVPPLKHFEYGS